MMVRTGGYILSSNLLVVLSIDRLGKSILKKYFENIYQKYFVSKPESYRVATNKPWIGEDDRTNNCQTEL